MRAIGMTVAESDHRTAVHAWLAAAPRDPSLVALVQAFEAAFASLWHRSHVVLGEVTLTAIVERVLYTAIEQHPLLASIGLDPPDLRCHVLAADAGADREQVAAALELVLVELLTVLGTLTAEILTPALHEALADAAAGRADDVVTGSEAP
jgi:hypothetical protein